MKPKKKLVSVSEMIFRILIGIIIGGLSVCLVLSFVELVMLFVPPRLHTNYVNLVQLAQTQGGIAILLVPVAVALAIVIVFDGTFKGPSERKPN